MLFLLATGEAAPPDLVQTVVLNVMGFTSQPAIAFEPRDIDFGVLLVQDHSTRPITLVNNSDSDVSYNLKYVAYPASTEVQGRVYTRPLGRSSIDEPLACQAPSGILPARSKTVTEVGLLVRQTTSNLSTAI